VGDTPNLVIEFLVASAGIAWELRNLLLAAELGDHGAFATAYGRLLKRREERSDAWAGRAALVSAPDSKGHKGTVHWRGVDAFFYADIPDQLADELVDRVKRESPMPESHAGFRAMKALGHSGAHYTSLINLIEQEATKLTGAANLGELCRGSVEGAESSPATPGVPRQSPCTQRPVLTVERWSDLGIGIEQGEKPGELVYLAVTPCPECGDVFPKRKAKELHLPGRRWRALLKLLAESEQGNTADKRTSMERLGYLEEGTYTPKGYEELMKSGGMQVLKRPRTLLTRTTGDLSRDLREQVDVESPGKKAALSVAQAGVVEAAFTVRYLVRGQDGKLRFGSREDTRHAGRS